MKPISHEDQRSLGGTRSGARRLVAVAALTASVLQLAACGDDDDAASGPDVCETRDDLQTSVDALMDVDVVEQGSDALEAAVADMTDAADAMAEAAAAELDDEVDDLRTAIDELETAVSTVGDADGPAAAVADVSSAVATVASAVTELDVELGDDCG